MDDKERFVRTEGAYDGTQLRGEQSSDTVRRGIYKQRRKRSAKKR